MNQIKLTKNELKRQKDNLKRFRRYLPMLELRKKLLMQEINRIREALAGLEREAAAQETAVAQWAAVYADDVDLQEYVSLTEIRTATGNIAGIDIPVFQEVLFDEREYDFFETPPWIDSGIPAVKSQISRKVEIGIIRQQLDILQKDLESTIQRIKLFEAVKIPEAQQNIRVIRIFLGDQQTAEVARGKLVKAKLERRHSA